MMSEGFVNREVFLAKRPRMEPVDVPGMGTVYVRALSVRERSTVLRKINAIPKDDPERDSIADALVVIASACDENGKPLLKYDDMDSVLAMDWRDIQPIYATFNKVNAAPDLGDLEKN